MFGLGMTEILLIAVIALVVVGPKKLPDIAKSIGKGYGEFRRSFSDLKQSVNIEDSIKDEPVAKNNIKQDLVDQYKSQWEQKLPPAPTATQTVAEEKSDEKKESGEPRA